MRTVGCGPARFPIREEFWKCPLESVMNNLIVSRVLTIVLIFCLCGVPQALAQTPQALPDSPSYTWQTRQPPTEIAAALPPQQPQEPAPQQPESLPAEEEQLPDTDA